MGAREQKSNNERAMAFFSSCFVFSPYVSGYFDVFSFFFSFLSLFLAVVLVFLSQQNRHIA